MLSAIDMRAKMAGNYILENKCTVREASKELGYSKSTIHHDVHVKLKEIDYSLYLAVKQILDFNMSIRHIRGGESTRQRYLNMSKHG